MKRIYVKVIGGNVSVYYRPTHGFITCFTGDNDKRKEVIKGYLDMSPKEFYQELINHKVSLPDPNGAYMKGAYWGDREKWYEEAWRYGTEVIMDLLEIEDLDEEIPFDVIRELTGHIKKEIVKDDPNVADIVSADSELEGVEDIDKE